MLLRQAYAERRDQIARQIGEVFRQAAAQQGYDTTELARLAGYSDLVTGARQVEHLMVAGRSRDTGMANALAKALRGRYLSPFPLWKPWGTMAVRHERRRRGQRCAGCAERILLRLVSWPQAKVPRTCDIITGEARSDETPPPKLRADKMLAYLPCELVVAAAHGEPPAVGGQ